MRTHENNVIKDEWLRTIKTINLQNKIINDGLKKKDKRTK